MKIDGTPYRSVWVDQTDGWSVRIFDQTKLPWSLDFLRLTDLGGAAHRDLVVAYIAKRRGAFRPTDTLRGEIEQAFANYCGGAIDPRASSLLHQPYGPLSQRWALTDRAYRLLRGGDGLARAR